jgi:hypothetical protein
MAIRKNNRSLFADKIHAFCLGKGAGIQAGVKTQGLFPVYFKIENAQSKYPFGFVPSAIVFPYLGEYR